MLWLHCGRTVDGDAPLHNREEFCVVTDMWNEVHRCAYVFVLHWSDVKKFTIHIPNDGMRRQRNRYPTIDDSHPSSDGTCARIFLDPAIHVGVTLADLRVPSKYDTRRYSMCLASGSRSQMRL